MAEARSVWLRACHNGGYECIVLYIARAVWRQLAQRGTQQRFAQLVERCLQKDAPGWPATRARWHRQCDDIADSGAVQRKPGGGPAGARTSRQKEIKIND